MSFLLRIGCILVLTGFGASQLSHGVESSGEIVLDEELEDVVRDVGDSGCNNPLDDCEECETDDGMGVCSGVDNGECSNSSSPGGSIIHSVAANHIHMALDYCYDQGSADGCAPCGGQSSAVYNMPTLKVRRMHRYRENWAPSSFGPGAFAQWDSMVQLSRTKADGSGSLKVLDITHTGQFSMRETGLAGDNQVDGFYRQPSWGLLRYARLVGPDEQTVIDQHDAAYIDMHAHGGAVFRFEIIRISTNEASPTRFGRPLRWTDRNGNGYTLEYVYPADSTDEELGFSRERLRMIASVTDAYGQRMDLTYKDVQVAGRWVVERIDLPNGEQLFYSYDNERLVRVDHPDGTISTFERGFDSATALYTVTYDDAASDDTHRRKTAYHTAGAWVDPDDPSIVLPQSGNRIRMVVNGAGEVTYLRLADPTNPERIVMYEGGGKWRRYRSVSFQPQQEDAAVSVAFTTNPAGANGKERFESLMATLMADTEWELTKKYRTNTQRQIVRSTDILGREKRYSVDNGRGRAGSATHFDGTLTHYRYDEWNNITRYVDRLGRVTTYDRDANGNVLVKTVGLALLDPSDPDGAVVATDATSVFRWEYNARGQVAVAYDALYDPAFPDLHVTEYFYHETGDPSAVDPAATDPLATSGYLVAVRESADHAGGDRAVRTMAYDLAGNLYAQTDAVGRTTVFGYDERNRVVEIGYADGSTDAFVYGRPDNGRANDANLIISQTDRNGNREDRTYDANGRMVSVVEAANDVSVNVTTSMAYVSGTELALSSVKAGDSVRYEYDYRLRAIGRTSTPRSGAALTSRTLYDSVRRAFGREDAYGRRSYTAYNIDNDAVRSVTETVPGALDAALGLGGALPTNDQLLALPRQLADNPSYLIEDRVFDSEDQLLRSVDARGVTSDFQYDQQGRRIQSDVATGQIQFFATADQIAAFDGSVFTAETDSSVTARSQTVYDANSNVVRQIHPREFDSTDAVGGLFRTAMSYTGRNLVASRTEAEGRFEQATEFFAYHADRTQASRTDFRGNTTTVGYEPCCQRVRVTVDPTGAATVVDYDDYGNQTYQVTLSSYDASMFDTCCNGTSISAPDAETLAEATTRYDARHRPIARTQWLTPLSAAVDPTAVPIAGLDGVDLADGLTTFYAYDDNAADGLDLVFPDGTSVPYPVDLTPLSLGAGADGAAMAMANPEGEVTVSIVDGMGRTVLQTDAEGHWVRTELDQMVAAHGATSMQDGTVVDGAPGELLQVTVIDELTRSFGYRQRSASNAAGQTLQVTDAEGETSQVAYDAQGNRTKVVDANGIGQCCDFDLRGRDVQCTDSQGDVTSRVYNVVSQVVESTDALGASSTSRFDARGRQVQTIDRVNGTTLFAYDDNSNLTQLVDAEGGITTYAYDPRNLLELETFPTHLAGTSPGDPGNDARSYSYDALRRLTQRVDQLGQATGYEYDLASRLERRSYHDGLDDLFSYDRASRLLSAISDRYDVGISRSYNNDGTLASEITNIDGASYPVHHTYDVANRMIGCVYPSGSAVTKGWTDRDQLATVDFSASAGGTTSIATSAYDAGMREVYRQLGNGVSTDFRYNVTRGDNLVEQIVASGVVDFSYIYDANKRKQSVANAIPEMTGFSQAFGYDADDRLVDWTRNNGLADGLSLVADQDWRLSLVGDWDETILDGVSQLRTQNEVHEVIEIDGEALAYDAKGNLVTDTRGASYTWDVENRLQAASVPNPSGGLSQAEEQRLQALLRLDASLERLIALYEFVLPRVPSRWQRVYRRVIRILERIQDRVQADIAALESRRATEASYRYDALGRRVQKTVGTAVTTYICAGPQVVAEYDTAGDLAREYVYGAYVDEPLVVADQDGDLMYYHRDHRYSVVAMTNSTGVVTERYGYDAFGDSTVLSADGLTELTSASQPYRTTGRRFDEETGLHYFRYRYFDAALGGFIARDPRGYIDGMSMYLGYFMPLGVDPFGLEDGPASDWETADFIWHYFFGGGEEIDLEEIGLLDDYLANSRVMGGITDFMSDMVSELGSGLDCSYGEGTYSDEVVRAKTITLRTPSASMSDTRYWTEKLADVFLRGGRGPSDYQFSPLNDPLWSIGGSTVHVLSRCRIQYVCGSCCDSDYVEAKRYRISCSSDFIMHDEFTNPHDWISVTYRQDREGWERVYNECLKEHASGWYGGGIGAYRYCERMADQAYPPSDYPTATPYAITATWTKRFRTNGWVSAGTPCTSGSQ